MVSIDVDGIISRHIEARGGLDRIRAIRTLVYSDGKYHEGDYTGSGHAFMAFMRPYFRVVGDPRDAHSPYMEGYDGSAWEWYANPKVVVRTVGDAAGSTRRGADFDGALVDYAKKGHRVVLGPETSIAGKPAYELKVTLRDGYQRSYFIDATTFLIVAERSSSPRHAFGRDVATETRLDDFRRVEGVLFPYHYTEVELGTGKPISEMQWGSIRADEELPRSWFSPPVYERNPLESLLEHLFQERTDTPAVLWSYDQFRRAHPGVDTRAGVEFIGYQMLKMADNGSAVPLLKSNAGDYPDSSSSAFSLARAFQASGDLDGARRELKRALKLDPANKRAAQALAALP